MNRMPFDAVLCDYALILPCLLVTIIASLRRQPNKAELAMNHVSNMFLVRHSELEECTVASGTIKFCLI